jgi:hypothetical protein
MATPQSPDTRPTDLETPGDVDTPDTPIPASSDLPTDPVTDFPMSELEATEDRESVSDVEQAIAEDRESQENTKQHRLIPHRCRTL